MTSRRYNSWRLFGLLLLLDTSVFLLQKFASSRAGEIEGWEYYRRLLTQPWLWLALAMGPLQLWTWTRILSRVNISKAYPITSLSYPVTMLCAWLIFREHLPWPVWAGAALITVGVALVGKEAADSPDQAHAAKAATSSARCAEEAV